MVHTLSRRSKCRRFQLQVRPVHRRFVTGNGGVDPGANEGQLVTIRPGFGLQKGIQKRCQKNKQPEQILYHKKTTTQQKLKTQDLVNPLKGTLSVHRRFYSLH
jgi:hypothetical protein